MWSASPGLVSRPEGKDFVIVEVDEALRIATEEHNNRTAEYLLGIPLLPDYLEEGLAAFELSCD